MTSLIEKFIKEKRVFMFSHDAGHELSSKCKDENPIARVTIHSISYCGNWALISSNEIPNRDTFGYKKYKPKKVRTSLLMTIEEANQIVFDTTPSEGDVVQFHEFEMMGRNDNVLSGIVEKKHKSKATKNRNINVLSTDNGMRYTVLSDRVIIISRTNQTL